MILEHKVLLKECANLFLPGLPSLGSICRQSPRSKQAEVKLPVWGGTPRGAHPGVGPLSLCSGQGGAGHLCYSRFLSPVDIFQKLELLYSIHEQVLFERLNSFAKILKRPRKLQLKKNQIYNQVWGFCLTRGCRVGTSKTKKMRKVPLSLGDTNTGGIKIFVGLQKKG